MSRAIQMYIHYISTKILLRIFTKGNDRKDLVGDNTLCVSGTVVTSKFTV